MCVMWTASALSRTQRSIMRTVLRFSCEYDPWHSVASFPGINLHSFQAPTQLTRISPNTPTMCTALTHAYNHVTYLHAHTFTNTHTGTQYLYTYTHIRMLTHTLIHSYTHSLTHTHTTHTLHTHTHTHTQGDDHHTACSKPHSPHPSLRGVHGWGGPSAHHHN